MLGVVTLTFVLISGLCVGALVLLDVAARDPERVTMMASVLGSEPATFASTVSAGVVSIANWLLLTQFMGISAVLAGHSLLHDRQSHTLPFLLLAPVRRVDLLAGKVLGSIAPSMAAYLLISGVAFVAMAMLPITQPAAASLPPSPAWCVSFLVGGPLWALFLGTCCAVISSTARDVRTAQQVVWFAVLFASFGCGYLLSVLLSEGVGVQLAVAAVGAACLGTALAAGSQVISRDLGR